VIETTVIARLGGMRERMITRISLAHIARTKLGSINFVLNFVTKRIKYFRFHFHGRMRTDSLFHLLKGTIILYGYKQTKNLVQKGGAHLNMCAYY
jgi:hypothetical protein